MLCTSSLAKNWPEGLEQAVKALEELDPEIVSEIYVPIGVC